MYYKSTNMFAGKTLGAGLSLGLLSDIPSDYNSEAGSETSTLVGHHVSTDVNSWWKEQLFVLEKRE